MVRIQIQLTDTQASRLKRVAAERGVSMAAVIRELLEQQLSGDPDARRRRALDVVGRYASGLPDLAEQHDRYFAEAYDN